MFHRNSINKLTTEWKGRELDLYIRFRIFPCHLFLLLIKSEDVM